MDTLQKYKNTPLYDVPEDFFEQLQHDVLQRVVSEDIRRKTLLKWVSVMSIAASVAIIVMLTFFLFENKNLNEPFYAYGKTSTFEDTIFTLDSNHLVEATGIVEQEPIMETKPCDVPPIASEETIAYHAVDYYLDEYESDSFYEMMYELECYYEY